MFLSKIISMISLALSPAPSDVEHKPAVVVVGAGLAGLTTAYRLQQWGIPVQVYEARGRIGGRIFSAKIGDDVVELGGQNIGDGGSADNMRCLIDEFSLQLRRYQFRLKCQFFDGMSLIPGTLFEQAIFDPPTLRSILDRAVQTAENMYDVLSAIFSKEDPLYRALAVRLAAYEGGPIEKLSPLCANSLYHILLGGIGSSHPNSENQKNVLEAITVAQGNSLLTAKLAESLGEKIHLSMPLVRVAKALDHSYELSFQNGQKVKADILVLAIPCSVYDDILFEGVIPSERLASIRSIQYGTNAKIFIPFSEELVEKAAFLNDRVAVYFADPRVATLYCTGEAGRFSKETISQAYMQERPMLESGFGDLCPPFSPPVVARDEFMGSYKGPVGYSWPNDPYAKGSYSYIAAGQESLLTALHEVEGETVKTLFAPIDNTLFFCGEHASVLMDVSGTMEAACESGERTARMIVNRRV